MIQSNMPLTERKNKFLRLNINYYEQKAFTLNEDEITLLRSACCFICDEEFAHLQGTFAHLRGEHGVFNCLLCVELYASQADLEAHILEKHIVFFCTTCSFLGSLENYEIHKKSRCVPDNSRIMFYKTSVLIIKLSSITPRLECTLCPVKVLDEISMEAHSRKCHGLGSTELFSTKLINIPPNSIKSIVKAVDLTVLKEQLSDKQLTLCGFCKLPCDNFSRLEQHLKRRHKHFPCKLCSYSAVSDLLLMDHVIKCHNNDVAKTEALYKSFNRVVSEGPCTAREAASHDQETRRPTEDSINPVTCEDKSDFLKTAKHGTNSIKSLGVDPTPSRPISKALVECHLCKFTGKNLIAFIDHYRARHEVALFKDPTPYPLICPECSFETPFHLSYHKHMQTKHKMHTCGLCETMFETPEELIDHVQTTCNIVIHKALEGCSICHKLDDPEAYLNHLRDIHLRDFLIPTCHFCGFTVDEKGSRLDFCDHLMNKHGVYACDICHVEYRSIQRLINHINLFSGI